MEFRKVRFSDLLYSTSISTASPTLADSEVVLYADDMEIHASAKDVSAAEKRVNKDLKSTATWWNQNGLISNHKKCEAMLIGSKHAVKNTRALQIILNGNQ